MVTKSSALTERPDATAPSLRQIGEALYGPRWQSDLARDLGVSDRTMRRWVADPGSMPPSVWAELANLCRERARRLEALACELERISAD